MTSTWLLGSNRQPLASPMEKGEKEGGGEGHRLEGTEGGRAEKKHHFFITGYRISENSNLKQLQGYLS